jgi:hypothetical protein
MQPQRVVDERACQASRKTGGTTPLRLFGTIFTRPEGFPIHQRPIFLSMIFCKMPNAISAPSLPTCFMVSNKKALSFCPAFIYLFATVIRQFIDGGLQVSGARVRVGSDEFQQ